MAEPNIKLVKIEPLTEEAFKPFGEVLGPLNEREPTAVSPSGASVWWSDFSADGSPLVAVASFPYRKPPTEWICGNMEQHLRVKQTNIPLEGKPSIMLVAPATPWRSKPDLDQCRAFLLDGVMGVVMDELCWHNSGLGGAPSIFPLYPPALNCVVIHCREVWEDELAHTYEYTYRLDLEGATGSVVQLTW